MDWFEIEVDIPEQYRNWHKQFHSEDVLEVPSPHITLLYGFDPRLYDQVKADVMSFRLQPEDWSFPYVPRPGNKAKNAWLLPIHSPRLEELFWQLYKKYPNQHYLHDGKFIPHITLCYMKKDIDYETNEINETNESNESEQ